MLLVLEVGCDAPIYDTKGLVWIRVTSSVLLIDRFAVCYRKHLLCSVAEYAQ